VDAWPFPWNLNTGNLFDFQVSNQTTLNDEFHPRQEIGGNVWACLDFLPQVLAPRLRIIGPSPSGVTAQFFDRNQMMKNYRICVGLSNSSKPREMDLSTPCGSVFWRPDRDRLFSETSVCSTPWSDKPRSKTARRLEAIVLSEPHVEMKG
jgi:hypothetical protein